jgi:hypothetical protein
MTTSVWFRTFYQVAVVGPRIIWLSMLVPILVVVTTVAMQPQTTLTQQLMWAAGILQGLGVLQVAWGIHELRVELGQPTLKSLFGRWFSKALSLVGYRKSVVVNITGAGGAVAAAGSASARGLVVDPASIESRIKALETQMGWLQADLQSKTAEIHRRIDGVSTEARQENRTLRAESRELRQLLDRVFIGGLDLEVTGLTWILIGQALGTWPDVFARIAQSLIA